MSHLSPKPNEEGMTVREAWQLLTDLDALFAREEWQDAFEAIVAMELRIADETGVGRLHDEYLDGACVPMTLAEQVAVATWKDTPAWKWPHPERSVGAPFLRSRDAAAMLEATMPGYCIEMRSAYSHLAECQGHVWITVRAPEGVILPLRHAPEAAWRTRAALEAGFRVGLWPVRREG